MGFQEASGYCKRCRKAVLVRRPGTNHVLHLLLTIVTAGLWIIVWIGVGIKIGGWRCANCGRKAKRSLLG